MRDRIEWFIIFNIFMALGRWMLGTDKYRSVAFRIGCQYRDNLSLKKQIVLNDNWKGHWSGWSARQRALVKPFLCGVLGHSPDEEIDL